MRRVPARPVRACFVRRWCTVPKVALEAPHFTLHLSHFTLHTSHLHFTLRTLIISSHLRYSHLISYLVICHLSSSQLFSFHQSPAQPFSSHGSSSQLISALLHVRKLLLSERTLVHAKTVARRKLLHRSFCTQKLETQVHLHRKALCTEKLFKHSKLLDGEALWHLETDAFTHGSFYSENRRNFYTQSFYTQNLLRTSLRKAIPSTTLYYKTCTKYSPVLLCTTKLAQSTSQW